MLALSEFLPPKSKFCGLSHVNLAANSISLTLGLPAAIDLALAFNSLDPSTSAKIPDCTTDSGGKDRNCDLFPVLQLPYLLCQIGYFLGIRFYVL